jgi:hypothetical protein
MNIKVLTDQTIIDCSVLCIIVCPFVPFLLAIVLSVLLLFTASDYIFSIFKLFLLTRCTFVLC